MSSRRVDGRLTGIDGGDRREPIGGARRVLLAHDAAAATCDALVRAIAAALDDVEIVDASSIHDARLAVATEAFDTCLICLDLPPAPIGGARLANELVNLSYPVVLVTRSLRWLPPDATALRRLPWIAPDASAADVAKAIAAASAECDSGIRPRAALDELFEEADPSPAARLRR